MTFYTVTVTGCYVKFNLQCQIQLYSGNTSFTDLGCRKMKTKKWLLVTVNGEQLPFDCSFKMVYLLCQWRLLFSHWTWLSAGSYAWSALAVWCKTGSHQHWAWHTCCLGPQLLYNCRSWSWDRPEEGEGRCSQTGWDVGAGSCLLTYPSGGRWPPCKRRSEDPPPWWQLLMRPPQPLTAPDHSWQNAELNVIKGYLSH